MECKFIKHGVALAYDQVAKPCCAWMYDSEWKKQNHLSQIDLGAWHKSTPIVEASNILENNQWPTACKLCRESEEQGRGDSIRGNGNHAYQHYKNDDITLEIRPGNVCNYACQTCWPAASSRVAEFHSRAGLIDIKSVDSNTLDNFDFLLPVAHRLRDIVLLGGEPFYDKHCIKFLQWAGQNLTANMTMFTNGSHIDFEFLKSYNGQLTIVFSLDAVGKPSEYIRFGSEWATVKENYLAVKKLSNINTRVNITCSVYNYLYIEELIDFLCQDWPSVVSFGSPRNNYLIESAIPLDHRGDMISSLKRAVEIVQQTDIKSEQKSNAINALTAHLTNLKTKPCVDADYDQLCDFIARMDKVKNIRMEDYCPDLSVVFK